MQNKEYTLYSPSVSVISQGFIHHIHCLHKSDFISVTDPSFERVPAIVINSVNSCTRSWIKHRLIRSICFYHEYLWSCYNSTISYASASFTAQNLEEE